MPSHPQRPITRTLIRSAGAILLLALLLVVSAALIAADANVDTITVGDRPTALAVNPVTNKIYVVNQGDGVTTFGDLTVIDGLSRETTTLAAGTTPVAVAVNPTTNRVYVANRGSHDVTIIDGATDTVITTISDPNADQPAAIAVDLTVDKIYVANAGSDNVTIIDGPNPSANLLTVSLPGGVDVGEATTALAVDPVTHKVYLANSGSNQLTEIAVDFNNPPATSSTTFDVGLEPVAVAVDPVTNRVYVANFGGNSVSVFDAAAGTVQATVNVGQGPQALVANPLTNRVYVANVNSNVVAVIDGTDNSTAAVSVGLYPSAIALNPITNKVYVGNDGDDSVTVIDGGTNAATTLTAISTGFPVTLAVNPVSGQVFVTGVEADAVTIIDGGDYNLTTISDPAANGDTPYKFASNPITNKVYVATNGGWGYVTAIDIGNNTVKTSIRAASFVADLVINTITNKLYVATDVNSVKIYDGGTDTFLTNVGLPGSSSLRNLALNPVTNKIYVANHSHNSVTVIDGRADQLLKTITGISDAGLTALIEPYRSIAVNPDTNKVYVVSYDQDGFGQVTIIDGETDTVLTAIPTGLEPVEITVNPITNRAYAAYTSEAGKGRLVVIDGATDQQITDLDLQIPSVEYLALSPSGKTVYYWTSRRTNTAGKCGSVDETNLAVQQFMLCESLGGVNPTTNQIYEVYTPLFGQETLFIYDGRSNQQAAELTIDFLGDVFGIDPVNNQAYLTAGGSDMHIVTEQVAEFNPLAVTIAPLPNHTTYIDNPTFSFTAATTTPAAQQIYYQVDTWLGPWQQAAFDGSNGVGTTPALPDGLHVLYAFATNGQEAQSDAPFIGRIAAYPFLVAAGQANEISLTPDTLTFSALAGAANPASQQIAIDNLGGGDLTWSARPTGPWLTLSQGHGSGPATLEVSADISDLAADTYTGQIVIESNDPNTINSPQTVAVTLTVGDKNSSIPLLQASPPFLTYRGVAQVTAPSPQTFSIANLGGGNLAWTADSNVPWLTLDRTAGNGPATLNASVSITGLPAGNHVGQITIRSDNAQGSPQLVNVLLSLDPGPTLGVETANLIFNARKNQGNPPDQSFRVTNRGEGDVTWTATEAADWLSLSPAQGPTPATVQAAVDISGLAVGRYFEPVVVDGGAAANSPQQVAASLAVRQGAILRVDLERPQRYPQLIVDTILGETPDPQPIRIRNAGFGVMNWAVEEDIPWLSFAQTAGSGGTDLQAIFDISGLEPQDEPYTGQVTIRSDNAEASPQTVQVALTVSSPARYCRIPDGGSDWIINTGRAKLKFENVSKTFTADGGCDLDGQLRVDLPQNANISADITGHVDVDNNFLPTSSSPLVLNIANFQLELAEGFSINDELGLVAEGGAWDIPPLFGGGQSEFDAQVQIGPNGISIAGQQSFALPNLEWDLFKMTNNQGSVSFTGDGKYEIEIDTDMEVVVSGSAGAMAHATLRVQEAGVRTGTISNFKVRGFAGMDLEVRGGKFRADHISVSAARLRMPQEWGGADVTLYNLTIKNNGQVSIGGGEFRLPNVAGSANLTGLYGSLRTRPGGGYEVRARGNFSMPAFQSAGSCAMKVDVILYTGARGASVLEIASPSGTPAALPAVVDNRTDPRGLQLREVTVGMRCTPGIAIGATSFYITGAEGRIALSNGIDYVSIQLWIEHGTKIGGKALVSMDPRATIYPSPFQLDFEGNAYIVGRPVSRAEATITSRKFAASITFEYVVLYGGFSVDAGPGYFEGSGWAEVGVQKGAIYEGCATVGIWSRCISVPDSAVSLASADASLNLNRVRGSVSLAGYGAGFTYNFGDGSLALGRRGRAMIISSAQIQPLRQLNPAPGRRLALPTGPGHAVTFTPQEAVLITVPITTPVPAGGALRASEVITPYAVALQQDVIFALIQPPEGTLDFSLIAPGGAEITPDTLPANVQFSQTAGISETQSTYIVAQATAGEWQTKVSGETTTTQYDVLVLQNSPPPVLSDLTITPAGQANQFEAGWRLTAVEPGTTIDIFVNDGPLEATVSFTNTTGTVITETVARFVGQPLLEDLAVPINGSLISQTLDLSHLPSGTYTLWLAADDGGDIPAQAYLKQGDQVAQMVVDQAATFPESWSPTINTTVDIKIGRLAVEWDFNPHPDIDSYTLHLRSTDPLSPARMITRTLDLGEVGDGATGLAWVDNIEPGQTYHLTVEAADREAGRSVTAPEIVITTPQPDFIISLVQSDPAVASGGPATQLPLSLVLADNLPYPVQLTLDYERLPDGIKVIFPTDVVTQTGEMPVSISASETLPPGYYPVPLLGRSGLLERELTFSLQVEPPGAGPLFLPLIMK